MSKSQPELFLPKIIISIQNLINDHEIAPVQFNLIFKSIGTFSFTLTDKHYTFDAETINSCAPKKAFSLLNQRLIGLIFSI